LMWSTVHASFRVRAVGRRGTAMYVLLRPKVKIGG
jgi:hypothetical protein